MTKNEIMGVSIGDNCPAYVIAEIGINHNGDLATAKKLMDVAVECGCNAVKFQKRTVSVVYTDVELDQYRESTFGKTNRALKNGLEFGEREYREIVSYSQEIGIDWLASCWDEASVEFVEAFNPACYKIASASLTDESLLRYHRKFDRPVILSTGMSTIKEVDRAVEILGSDNLIILHCTSTYPTSPSELNLRAIPMLQARYGVPVGYSGHETGLASTVVAVALGACVIERHITLDRAMWGSDQAASVEPSGLKRLVRDIRTIEQALGDGEKCVYDSELPIREKLRRKK
jgi:N-acetylneuraminate synthase